MPSAQHVMSASWQVTRGSTIRKHGNRGCHPTAGLSVRADFHTHTLTHSFLLLIKQFLQELFLKQWWSFPGEEEEEICIEPLVFSSTFEQRDDHIVKLGMWIYEYISIQSDWKVFPVLCLWAGEERWPVAIIAAVVKLTGLVIAGGFCCFFFDTEMW